jgi:hypothetical protein
MDTGSVLRHRYRLIRPLGHGGMADVYLAFDEKRRVEVAVKLLREDLAEDAEFLRRFEREAQALARLDHPYVVRFYSLEREGATSFIVMDYVAGTTLRARIAEAGGPLPLPEVTRVLRQIGSALQYAHNEGFIHRDIKPGNIMLREDGSALLSDFGIARAAEAVTMTQGTLGTPAYMSPEQILGRVPDLRTDVYALGVVLYEMVTGRRPFLGEAGTGSSATERGRDEHLHRDPPDPRLLNPALPAALAAIVVKAMAKDPAERWQSVEEFVATWSEVAAPPAAGAHTIATPALSGEAMPVAPQGGSLSRIPTAAIVAAAAVVALALIALVVVALNAIDGGGGSPTAVLGATDAPRPTAIALATAAPSATGSAAATPTAKATVPAAGSTAATARPSVTPTGGISAQATGTPTATPAPSDTPTATVAPTDTETPVPPTDTPTPAPSPTPSETPTPACAADVDPDLAYMWDQASMGCPMGRVELVWSAWEPFQTGSMFWRYDTGAITAFYSTGAYDVQTTPWTNATPVPSRGDPPAGLLAPVRGFGYVWGTYDGVSSALGWATAEEKGFCASLQPFENGYLARSSTAEFCPNGSFNWARDPSFTPVAIRVLGNGTWVQY